MLPIALLATAGCQQAKQPEAKPADPPVGRFQIVPMSDSSGVYVLDTRDGLITHCATTLNFETWCTRQANVTIGEGPPAYLRRQP